MNLKISYKKTIEMSVMGQVALIVLCATYAIAGQPDILIADFEEQNYGEWKVEGEAFGSGPAKGTLAGQQIVSGFKGEGLVNTFLKGDSATGTLTSPEFKVERKYICFLIGGGAHKETAIELLANGNVVQRQSGMADERLVPACFDVSGNMGKSVQLRIVDHATKGWGHINVDHIVHSDIKPEKPKNPWNIGKAAAAPYNPHKIHSEYKEDWRPQFHFSPKNEWMNDINALIYHNGVYHMLYQWGRSKRHGGYATSKDLLHWVDQGVALVPQGTFLPAEATRNVSGEQVFSGSGVFVTGETARKITGSALPALVTHYTGTKVGTCIAWSNDEGKSWHNYEKNPVANLTSDADPRDPCVIWYGPGKKWILSIYEHGTTFYGSEDLINWERLSNIGFGFECPDLVELPLDGDKNNLKWVIYDANGSYLVGKFDGTTFTDENKVKPFIMDCGPDFYAGQSFFPHNLPEKKYIQIAWNDHWNGGVGEKTWERNATFPVELGLVTRDGKMRVTRTPIEAIKKLYAGAPVRLSNVTLGQENCLKDIKSKAFDLSVALDLNNTAATEILFKITDVEYRYDIQSKQLNYTALINGNMQKKSVALLPDANGTLELRMLVDWSSIEIFADGGVFSFSQQIGFNPKEDTLSLTAIGGEVQLNRLELNNIKSIW